MLPLFAIRALAVLGLAHVVCAAPTFFRSDFGVPTQKGTVPSDLSSPQNLAWRSPVDSGHSTPIIEGGKLFLTTSRAENHELATICLDANSGKQLWKQVVPVPQIEEYHPEEGNAAMATPASDGSHIFVFFGSYGVICYDLEGKQVWEHRMGPFRDEYGAASSPIILDDKVILNEDHDIDSFLVALDRAIGRVLWKTPRAGAVRSYSTPAIWMREGKRELLVGGALELAGYDPSNGEKVWWVNGLARIVIPTPLPVGDVIYMASWSPGGDPGQRLSLGTWDQAVSKWDKNKDDRLAKEEINDREVLTRFFRMDLDQSQMLDRSEWEQHAEVFLKAQNSMLAIKPNGRGTLGEKAVLWKYQRGSPYVASPMFHKGVVWMVKDGGLVTKLDAASGELLQQERLGATGNYYASPVVADGKVFFASEGGTVTIVADERDWRIVGSHNFREKIFATPVIQNDRLYIRTEKAVYCYRPEKPVH